MKNQEEQEKQEAIDTIRENLHTIKQQKNTTDLPTNEHTFKTYEIGDVNVDVNYKEYMPKKHEDEPLNERKAVVFFPGWAMVENEPVVKKLSQKFADEAQARTFSIDTRADKQHGPLLATEAQAVQKFI